MKLPRSSLLFVASVLALAAGVLAIHHGAPEDRRAGAPEVAAPPRVPSPARPPEAPPGLGQLGGGADAVDAGARALVDAGGDADTAEPTRLDRPSQAPIEAGHIPRGVRDLERRTRASILLGLPVVEGALDPRRIRLIAKRHQEALMACYEARLATRPDLTGTVTTTFSITPDGGVAHASASGVDPEVARCIASVLGELRFPVLAGEGGARVTYPITFRWNE